MRCLECGTNTKAHRNHDYEYTESGLTNVILSGITVYTCEKCHATYPELPAVQSLHAAIAKDFLFRREALRGEEVRFLRKEMGIKAKNFAEMLGVTKVAVSRWEHSQRPLAAVTDRLIRCVFLLHRLSQRPPTEIRALLGEFQAGLAEIKQQAPSRPTQIDVGRELASVA